MTTLSQLLSSQEARDAAPCVPVTGPWVLTSRGVLVPAELWAAIPVKFGNCIWSGDLVAELAAVDALRDENDRLLGALRETDADLFYGHSAAAQKVITQALKGGDV